MLGSAPGKKLTIQKAERKDDELWLYLEKGMQKLIPMTQSSVRVLYTEKESFSESEKPGVILQTPFSQWDLEEKEEIIHLKLPKLIVEIDRQTNQFRYYDEKGSLLLQERKNRSKELDEFPVYQINEENLEKEYIETPDGRKEVIREASKVQVGTSYHTRLHLQWSEDEDLYGLGQHEEGYHSLRGNKVFLHQANRKIAIPMFVSTKGYGILVNTYGAAIFNDMPEGSYFYTEADPEMDFIFMNGSGMDGVIRQYRQITGKASMLPKWAFGYIQSQERYETQEEILRVAKQYREREIGLDCIVLDWCSWTGNQWGQKSFDPERFPNPGEMTKALHDDHVHFMISIWPNLSEGGENYAEFTQKGQMLPGCSIYNALSKEARDTYWRQADKGLFCHGVDAWWCDNSEPFTPEWNHMVRPESAKLYEEYCKDAGYHLPAEKTNVFGFYHAMGIYEGQRSAREGGKEKRVTNLTRSGYIGQQRFGTILWSGDISASWETLRRQIAAGLHFCASGLPYWTVDIGAFFVKYGMQWFWDGDYDMGVKDPAYCELFVRWFQWGAFLPIFRGHGTEIRRELWEFDQPQAPFYRALIKMNQLRYELLPYIYSLAGNTWAEDASVMRPLVFGFPKDKTVRDIMDQYLFGEGMMVCPVTKPMYFEIGGGQMAVSNCSRKVYLPEGCNWYDFWTEKCYPGGQWIDADAPLDKIPVFIKSGSIIPMAKAAGSAEESGDIEIIKVYAGADGEFTVYEDAGDGYGYEKGEYHLTKYCWKDSKKLLARADGEPVACEVQIICP